MFEISLVGGRVLRKHIQIRIIHLHGRWLNIDIGFVRDGDVFGWVVNMGCRLANIDSDGYFLFILFAL